MALGRERQTDTPVMTSSEFSRMMTSDSLHLVWKTLARGESALVTFPRDNPNLQRATVDELARMAGFERSVKEVLKVDATGIFDSYGTDKEAATSSLETVNHFVEKRGYAGLIAVHNADLSWKGEVGHPETVKRLSGIAVSKEARLVVLGSDLHDRRWPDVSATDPASRELYDALDCYFVYDAHDRALKRDGLHNLDVPPEEKPSSIQIFSERPIDQI